MVESDELKSGDVGYVVASIRDMAHIQPGDTITSKQEPCIEPLSGYKKIKPMVFSGYTLLMVMNMISLEWL